MQRTSKYKTINGFKFPLKIDISIEERMKYYCNRFDCSGISCDECGFSRTEARKEAFLKWEKRDNES